MDVHKESISIGVINAAGKIVMECVIETKASVILQFVHGLRGDLQVTFEEGTWAAWLYDLLKPHVTEVVVWPPVNCKFCLWLRSFEKLRFRGIVRRFGCSPFSLKTNPIHARDSDKLPHSFQE
jgi:hypothetical protein